MADPAVFLDRDGTLIEEVGYATRPEQIRILGGVARALKALAVAGYRLVVVTNQSGIARGLLTEDDLHAFHHALDKQLAVLGAHVDAYYSCPHLPDAAEARRPDLAVECDCRKPRPGLLLRAAEDLDLDLTASWLVGDTWRDILAGQAAGVRTIKVRADAAHEAPRPPEAAPPVAEVAGLDAAARIILEADAPAEDEAAAQEDAADEPDLGEATAAVPPPRGDDAAESTAEAEAEEADAELSAEAEAAALASAVTAEPPRVAEPSEPGLPELAEADAAPALAEPLPQETPPRVPLPEDAECARCGLHIAADDLSAGRAAQREGLLLCGDCLARQPREPSDALPADARDLVRMVVSELRRAQGTRESAGLTAWRLLAYVVMVLAVFAVVVGLVVSPDDRALFLQVAVLLQLAAVTLLLLERHS